MTSRLAGRRGPAERHLAVIDMGSNTFRLVVFRYRPGGSFQLVDEIRHAVRLPAGAGRAGLGIALGMGILSGVIPAFRAAGLNMSPPGAGPSRKGT